MTRFKILGMHEAHQDTHEKLHKGFSLDTSYNLYGSDIILGYDISHEFKKPVSRKPVTHMEDIVHLQQTFEGKWKQHKC